MSYNSIGLLKANGQIEEYGNTGGGGGNTDAIESQIGYVESTDTAASAHAVGSYFINKSGQFVKTTTAIAVGDTIAVGTNVVATDIAGVLTELNSNNADRLKMKKFSYQYGSAVTANQEYIIANAKQNIFGIPSNSQVLGLAIAGAGWNSTQYCVVCMIGSDSIGFTPKYTDTDCAIVGVVLYI